jgi:hypothetical protein
MLIQVARLEKALEDGRDRLEALAADQLRLRVELSCVPDSHAAAAAAAATAANSPTRNANAPPLAAGHGHGHGMPVTHAATPNVSGAEQVPASPLVSPPATIAASVLPPGADFIRLPRASTTVCPVALGECSRRCQ